MNELFDHCLRIQYGLQVGDNIDIIKDKINIVIMAHLYAGDQGDAPMVKVNQALNLILPS